MKKKSFTLLTFLFCMALFLNWHVILTIIESNEIKQYYNNGGEDYKFTTFLLKLENGDYAVMNADTGKLLKRNYFRFLVDKDRYVKASPDCVEQVYGSVWWRFFEAGVLRGDSETGFTASHWWQKQPFYSTLPRKPTDLNKSQLDPTNPTPFWITLLLLFIAFILDIRTKRILGKTPSSSSGSDLHN